MPKHSKLGKQLRQSLDNLIAAAMGSGSPEGLTESLMYARWGMRAKDLTNPLYILADMWHTLRSASVEELATNTALHRQADEAEALLADVTQRAMWSNKPEILEQLAKAMRQVDAGVYDSAVPDKIRLKILASYIRGDLNVYQLAKEIGADERHLRRIKARILPKNTPDK